MIKPLIHMHVIDLLFIRTIFLLNKEDFKQAE